MILKLQIDGLIFQTIDFQMGDELFAVPCDMGNYLEIYSKLKIVKAGQNYL